MIVMDNGGASQRAAGNSDPAWPTDYDMRCGFANLVQALPSVTIYEAVNEPEVNASKEAAIGSSCEPSMGYPASRCAASWFNDMAVMDKFLGRNDTLLAGTFAEASTTKTAPTGNCTTTDALSHFDFCYAYFLFWDYLDIPTHWSFHDYQDVQLSYNCTSIGASGCVNDREQNMYNMVKYWSTATPDIWITEAGVWLNGSFGSYVDDSRVNQANAAEGWLNLKSSGLATHVFYYQFTTTGDGQHTNGDAGFDSSLLGISQTDWSASGLWDPAHGKYAVPRSSYCVLAYGDSPAVAATDSRCNFVSTPEIPWSDWEGKDG